ncbi:hypothetical protein [Prevotella merdae]|uniref:hypothetical protein n=1 Tax=Prevotella merdae TaxID=2079531 RepID=UPI003569D6B1
MKRYVINHITELRNVGGFPVTTSTYDIGDRRTEVNHPASGITSFTYDALGNVQTKQTANLAKEGKFITYDYDYQRLTGITYPDHPENNVKYYYGGCTNIQTIWVAVVTSPTLKARWCSIYCIMATISIQTGY